MSGTDFRKSKRKSSNPTWNCELCDYISTSKRGMELHLKFSHKVENYKLETPSRKEFKKLKDNIEEGKCLSCRKSMNLHSKNKGDCP